jgi:hypothetical protein
MGLILGGMGTPRQRRHAGHSARSKFLYVQKAPMTERYGVRVDGASLLGVQESPQRHNPAGKQTKAKEHTGRPHPNPRVLDLQKFVRVGIWREPMGPSMRAAGSTGSGPHRIQSEHASRNNTTGNGGLRHKGK